MRLPRFAFGFFLFSFFLILLISQVSAIGVSPVSPEIEYVDNGSETITFTLSSLSDDVELSAEGPIAHYAEFDTELLEYTGSSMRFNVTVNFPPYEEVDVFGRQKLSIKARELPPEGSMIAATTAVKPSIYVNIPNPGLYATFDAFNIGSVSEGEDTSYSVTFNNAGTETFSGKTAELTITDLAGDIVETFTIDDITIEPQGSFVSEGAIPSSSYDPGVYEATVSFDIDPDRSPFTTSTKFFVGTTDVILLDHSQQVNPDTINKVTLELQSLWGSSLEGVRATITGPDDKEQSLPAIDFAPFETKNVTAFFEVPDMGASRINSTLTLKLPEDVSSDVVKTIPLSFEVVEEKSAGANEGFSFTTTTALVGVISLLVLVIAIILVVNTRKKN